MLCSSEVLFVLFLCSGLPLRVSSFSRLSRFLQTILSEEEQKLLVVSNSEPLQMGGLSSPCLWTTGLCVSRVSMGLLSVLPPGGSQPVVGASRNGKELPLHRSHSCMVLVLAEEGGVWRSAALTPSEENGSWSSTACALSEEDDIWRSNAHAPLVWGMTRGVRLLILFSLRGFGLSYWPQNFHEHQPLWLTSTLYLFANCLNSHCSKLSDECSVHLFSFLFCLLRNWDF